MEAEMQRAKVDDIDIAYWRVGSGVPLTVLHGGPGIGHTYLRPLDAWAGEGYDLIYYDQRGSGHTELGDAEKVSFAGAIADLDGLRAELGIEKLNLVGHSFGADLAVMYAAMRPDHTACLVVLNPGPPFVPELVRSFQQRMGARRSPEDDQEKKAIESSAGFASGDPATLERYILNTYTPFFSDRHYRDSCKLGFTRITAANIGRAAERMFRDLADLDPVASLANITCPTLVVHAENDPLPEEFSRLLADKIASAEYQYLGGMSHFVHFEDPATLAATVMPFLRTFAR